MWYKLLLSLLIIPSLLGADIASFNGTAIENIASINGTLKANIASIDGSTIPSEGGGELAEPTIYADDFNRANSAIIADNWTEVLGEQAINGNALEFSSTPFQKNLAINTGYPCVTVNQYAKVKLNTSGGYQALVFRYSNMSNAYYAVFFRSSEQDVEWARAPIPIAAGTQYTSIASSSLTWTSGDTFAVTLMGTGTDTTVRIWKNATGATPDSGGTTWGGASPTVTFTTDPASPVDTGYLQGLEISISSTQTVDDYSAGDIPGQTMPPAEEEIPFSPDQIAGLKLWMKADSGTDTTTDDTEIGTWSDNSGFGLNATASGADRPKYKANILNGKPVVLFEGADYLVTPTSHFTNTPAVTVIIVATATQSGVNDIFIEHSSNIDTVTDGFLAYRTSGNVLEAALRGSSPSFNVWRSSTTHTTQYKMLTFTFNKSKGGLFETEIKINNVKDGSVNVSNDQPANNTFGNHPTYFGRRGANTSFHLTGGMAEVLIYDTDLSIEDETKIYNYIVSVERWGTLPPP